MTITSKLGHRTKRGLPNGRHQRLAEHEPLSRPAHRDTRKPKLDDLDMQIMNALRHDGRTPSAQIARELGYPEGTVRYRVKRMRSKGLIVSFSMPALDRVAPRVLVVYLVRTIPGKAMELCEQLKVNPHVRYLALAGSGYHDLFISAGFVNEDELLDFRHRVMGGSGAVESFESVQLLKTIARSYDFTLPEEGNSQGEPPLGE